MFQLIGGTPMRKLTGGLIGNGYHHKQIQNKFFTSKKIFIFTNVMKKFELVYRRKEQGSKGTYGVDIYANSLEEARKVVESFPKYITNLCYDFKVTGEVVDNIVFLENEDLIEMGLFDQIDNNADYNYDFLFMLHQIDLLSGSEKEYVKECILEHELYELMKFYK